MFLRLSCDCIAPSAILVPVLLANAGPTVFGTLAPDLGIEGSEGPTFGLEGSEGPTFGLEGSEGPTFGLEGVIIFGGSLFPD
jgi:hypothetical protein